MCAFPVGGWGGAGSPGAPGPAGPAPSGAAGDAVRLVSSGVAGATSPDLVCTVAELSTTYAPSAVLRGVIAYTTNAGVTYVCRRTAASTYAWALLAAGATAAAARAAINAAESVAQPAYDFTSSTGLTTFLGNAGNTVTVGGGVAALYSPAAAGQLRFGNPLTGPALYRNFPTPVAEFDVATRVLAPVGTITPSYAAAYGIEVATLGAFANPALPRQRFTFLPNDGALKWEDETGFKEDLVGAVPLDGTGWLRVQLIGTTMTFWLGVGVGTALPTTWTMKKRWVPTAALYESVCVSLQIGGSMPTPVTANFGALAVLLPASL